MRFNLRGGLRFDLVKALGREAPGHVRAVLLQVGYPVTERAGDLAEHFGVGRVEVHGVTGQ